MLLPRDFSNNKKNYYFQLDNEELEFGTLVGLFRNKTVRRYKGHIGMDRDMRRWGDRDDTVFILYYGIWMNGQGRETVFDGTLSEVVYGTDLHTLIRNEMNNNHNEIFLTTKRGGNLGHTVPKMN